MWGSIIGSVIGAGSSLLGGILGSNSAAAQNQTQLDIARANMDMQREFAQNGIRWKAYDAQQAGIHPAFAMGAPTASYSPVAFNSQPDPMGGAIANMGQNIGRAAEAAITQQERSDKLMKRTADALTLNRMGLENELLRSQIARTNGQIGPPMPSLGQSSPGGGNSGQIMISDRGTYEADPYKVTTANPSAPSVAAGPAGPQNVYRRSADGTVQGFPDPSVIQDQEITNPLMLRWMLTQGWSKPPANLLPRGATDWVWTPTGWIPTNSSRSAGRYIGASRRPLGSGRRVDPWSPVPTP